MKRLFHQTKLYDYTTIKEAKEHINKMAEKGWFPFCGNANFIYIKGDENLNRYIYENGNDEFKYSVEFYKEH